ncbi:MAG: hypothetical protein JWQ16_1552 [Novosphingobium sp.]|nr:hypothetical protein [Novosphingobium sp.]
MRRLPRRFPYFWPYIGVEAALIVVLAVQCARLFWLFAAPVGPIGDWQIAPATDLAGRKVLTTVDPFFRASGRPGPGTVTSLPLKLYGVRLDEATGRGSAIIATPDGVQLSYAVDDAIMPGIRLKSVARDNVTLDRGGIAEQLYLDQSVPVAVAQPKVVPTGSPVTVPPVMQGMPPNVSVDRTVPPPPADARLAQ